MIRAREGTLDAHTWIPMRWPCGPLDVEKEKQRAGFSVPDEQALRAWEKPAALERLAGTPINCLVLTWATGSAADAEQQRTLAPLVAAARQRGLAVVGWASGSADLRAALAAAQAAGLSALATDSQQELAGADLLRFGRRGFADRTPLAFLGDSEAVFPGMKLDQHGADALSGPTSAPWIDSNAWYVRLARMLRKPRAIWLAFEPTELGDALPAFAYVQAIADTEMFGARWLLSLDPHLRRALAEERSAATETWRAIGRTLAFFRRHEAWAEYLPAGQLAVVSDFAGQNEFLAFEVLNLLARQSSLYQIVEKQRLLESPLGELDAVLWADEGRPATEVLQKLYSFAQAGGTLITQPGWETRGEPLEDNWTPRFHVFRYGKGRLAIARQLVSDPRELAEDAQLLLSHRRDRVRVFNQGIGLWHHGASADGRSAVLHAFLFPTPYPTQPMTLWFHKPWAAARLFTPENDAGTQAKRAPSATGVEFQLPAASAYCATEVTA